jgi:hypothetical protein
LHHYFQIAVNAMPAAPVARTTSRRCRYRVEQLANNNFVVVRRIDGAVIETGFKTYAEGWTWLIQRLDAEQDA